MSGFLLYAVLGLLVWGALIVLAVAIFHRAVLYRERCDAFADEHPDRERIGLPVERYIGERRFATERYHRKFDTEHSHRRRVGR